MLNRITRAKEATQKKHSRKRWTVGRWIQISLLVSVVAAGTMYFSFFYRKSVYAELVPLQQDYSQYNYK